MVSSQTRSVVNLSLPALTLLRSAAMLLAFGEHLRGGRHAARIAALTTERVSWEDFKKQQKEAAGIEAAAAADEAEQMRKYRAQLDADRAAKLAKVRSDSLLLTSALSDILAQRRRVAMLT